MNGKNRYIFLLCFLYLAPLAYTQGDDDFISGYNTFIFRSFNDRIFSGTDVRRSVNRDHYTIYNFLTIQKLKIFEDDDLRIFGAANAWLRQDLGDNRFSSSTKMDLSYGAIQIDRGRTADGFLKFGRIYNYRGLLSQRFDGAELYYPFDNGLEIDLYGGRRVIGLITDDDDAYLGGGRLGWRFNRRNTIGLSWLHSHTYNQWDDQKIGGDWYFTPIDWLELHGNWGYDRIADTFYEIESHARVRLTRDLDFRFIYDNVTPGLLLPKSSIFSVYSLAEEQRFTGQIVYHPNEHWTFLADLTYIDYDNDGGMGGPNNFFTALNALDGGYQWRYGGEIIFRYNPYDEIALRFEQMVEGNYGYTVTDLIRSNFDFRDFDPFLTSPEDAGFVFSEYENGFSAFSLSHWHEWSRKFSHALNFNYYIYDNPLFLHDSGDESFSTNFTLTYKPSRSWNISVGGRYLDSLADSEQFQFYLRITNHF